VLPFPRKLALETILNIFAAQRVSCSGQYDRIDDLIAGKLSGHKRPVLRQLLLDEFNFSAVFKRFDPLFVWHLRFDPIREISMTVWEGACLSVIRQRLRMLFQPELSAGTNDFRAMEKQTQFEYVPM
jgi:hypothetical protein